MSERLSRTVLAKAGSGLTDWSRIRGLRDEEIDAAIADDEDCFAMTDQRIANCGSKRVALQIRKRPDGRFRWKLSVNGIVVEEDRRGAKSSAKARKAMLRLVR